MPYELEKGENWKRTLKFDIPHEEIAEKYEESLKQASRLFSMPGFRPGRVPRQIIEKRLSKQLIEDTLENLRLDSFEEAIKELKIVLLGRPVFDETEEYEKGKSYKFEAEFEVEPEFELPSYKGLKFQRYSSKATDEEVQQELDSFQFRASTWVETEGRKAEEKDAIFADITIMQEGKEIQTDYDRRFTLRESQLEEFEIDDLVGKFLGVSTGDEKEIIVKLKNDLGDLKAGEECTLKFVIKKVDALTIPPQDDDLAKHYKFDSLEEMKMDLMYKIQEHKAKSEARRFNDSVHQAIAGLCEFDIPEKLLQMQTKHTYDRRKTEFLRMGINIEDFEGGKHADSFIASAAEDARQLLKEHFVIEKIASKEKIFATETEFMREIEAMANQYNISRQKMLSHVEKEDIGDQVRADILERKVIDLIIKNAEIEVIEGSAPEQFPQSEETQPEKPVEETTDATADVEATDKEAESNE